MTDPFESDHKSPTPPEISTETLDLLLGSVKRVEASKKFKQDLRPPEAAEAKEGIKSVRAFRGIKVNEIPVHVDFLQYQNSTALTIWAAKPLLEGRGVNGMWSIKLNPHHEQPLMAKGFMDNRRVDLSDLFVQDVAQGLHAQVLES